MHKINWDIRLPNLAGPQSAEKDEIITKELSLAGIKVTDLGFVLDNEVKTSILGTIGSWKFVRAWYYWMVDGLGMPPDIAVRLHECIGEEVRTAGFAGGIHPTIWSKGFAITNYHVDSLRGLKILADLIHAIYEEAGYPMRDLSGDYIV